MVNNCLYSICIIYFYCMICRNYVKNLTFIFKKNNMCFKKEGTVWHF